MQPQIIWEPQAGPQTALMACPCFEVFFGGARGGGKTDGMLGDFASHADLYGEHAIGLMLRRERTQLVEAIERSKEIYRPLGAVFHEQDKMWRFPNGARLRFAYLDNDADAENYQGHSYTRIYVEELTNFPSPKPILKLMACLRSGTGVPCGFRATGNPGGPGHGWVRARYIDPDPTGWKVFETVFENPWTKERITKDRVYIPSRVSDNLKLAPDYIANLQMSGSEQLVKAWLEGNWSIIAGVMFPELDENLHFKHEFPIPQHWTKIRTFDWGSGAPAACLWIAIAGADGPAWGVPRGSMIVYRELYLASKIDPSQGLGLSNLQMCEMINARSPYNEIIDGTLADKKPFQAGGGKTIAQEFKDNGIPLTQGDTKPGSRIQGWAQIRSRLVGANGAPYLYILRTCPHTWRTLCELQQDPDNLEDALTDGEDHIPDALSLAGKAYPWVKDKKADPTAPQNLITHQTADALFEQHFRLKRQQSAGRR